MSQHGFLSPAQPLSVQHGALDLIKARLGITSSVRDTYLTAIVNGVVRELEDEKGLVLDGANPYHLMFVVDYATWRYQSVAEPSHIPGRVPLAMPRHLQFRLHNLMIHSAGGDADDGDI